MIRANWPVGYGLVNYWHTIDPLPFAKALKKAGMTLTAIEWVPWFDVQPCNCKKTGGSDKYGGCSSKPHPKLAKAFVAAMAKKGITTMVVQENRNSCACRAQPDSYRDLQHKKIMKLLNFGPIWYCPFSEPWVASAGTEAWTKRARAMTPGGVWFVLPDRGKNNAQNAPLWGGIAYDYLDAHPCNDDGMIKSLQKGHPVLVNSDCTGTLNPGATRAAAWTRESARTKTGLHVYDFKGTQPDWSVISAMGVEIQRGMA